MFLTFPTILTQSYTSDDVFDLANVRQSSLRSSQLILLRFGDVPEAEMLQFLTKSIENELKEEFKHPRIASNEEAELGVLRGEHLIVRDLDLQPCSESKASMSGSATENKGRIVAHAEWRFNPSAAAASKNPPSQQPKTELECSPPLPLLANGALHRHFNELVESTLTTLIGGAPCYELRNISTTSSHLRKGIAKQLVSWINPFAQLGQLPVILAASPPGHGLYLACGFEDMLEANGEVLSIKVDMDNWGGEGTHQHVLMVKWPKGWSTSRSWEEYKSRCSAQP